MNCGVKGGANNLDMASEVVDLRALLEFVAWDLVQDEGQTFVVHPPGQVIFLGDLGSLKHDSLVIGKQVNLSF